MGLTAAHVAEAPARTLSVTLAWLAAALFALAGFGLLSESSAWVGTAITAAGAGLLLKSLYFHPWLSIGALIDVGVLLAVAVGWPSSLF